MIFQSELTAIDQELEAYERLLSAKRAQRALYNELQGKCNGYLIGLGELVKQVRGVREGAIATLKTEIDKLFGTDGGTDDGDGNQPIDPTPDSDPTPRPGADDAVDEPELLDKPLTFTPGSTIIDSFGSYGIVIGHNNLGMSVDWLGLGEVPNPPTGKGCWFDWKKDNHAIASLKTAAHDQVKLLTTSEFLQFQNWNKDQLDEYWDGEWVSDYGCQYRWGGATINRWIVVFAQSCEWASPFASPFATPIACVLWEDVPLLGQHCAVTFKQNENKGTSEGEDMPKPLSTEMVHLSANCGYLKAKWDGRILATYAWFSRKNIAESWLAYLSTIPAAQLDLRESKRNTSWKWELKITGLSMPQIERLSKEALHQKPTKSKETPAQAAGIEPPSDWRKPQVKEELPPCPFGIGDIIDWNGCRLRVSAIGVETLHCVLCSAPDGTKPHTKVPISECTLVEEGLDVGDKVEILSARYLGVKGEEVIVNGVFTTSELPIGVELPNGNTRYFPRNELKFLAKAPTSQPPTQTAGLQTGSVLLGSRVVTTGSYLGQGRANSINMARMGTADKVAALELVKAGVSPQEAMATVQGDYDF